jgi:endoglucanase Acf2
MKLPTSENRKQFINNCKLILNISCNILRFYLLTTYNISIAPGEFVGQKKTEKNIIFFNKIVHII